MMYRLNVESTDVLHYRLKVQIEEKSLLNTLADCVRCAKTLKVPCLRTYIDKKSRFWIIYRRNDVC